jgi:hypothetical protein
MSRTNHPTGEEDAGLKARLLWLLADEPRARVAAVRAVTGLALLCGIALSTNLWFSAARTFPRAPLVNALPAGLVTPFEYLAGGLLVGALAALVFAGRSGRFAWPLIILLVLLVLLDQTRLQPWVYQYLLLLTVVAVHGRRGADEPSTALTLTALRLIVASLYFWSGAQKLNYSFGSEVLPQLLAPLRTSWALAPAPWSALAVGVAVVEMFTGCGLLHRRTRRLCVCLALGMHVAVLGLLVLRFHNSVVWAWNVALMLLVVILFRRGDGPASVRPSPAGWRAGGPSARAALVLGVVCAVLPASSFWGWWDMYLSGALYSGNTPVAVVRVDGRAGERLPEVARRQVFKTQSGERMLPAFEWAMSELNVPPYPEPRVFKKVAREVCKLAGDDGRVELIMKGRPAIRDGNYDVLRMNCSQLQAGDTNARD